MLVRGRGLLQRQFPFLTAALLSPCLSGCSSDEPVERETARPVKLMVVTAGDDLNVRSFPGTVEAARRVELAFQVSGRLVELPVKAGQRVAKGDLIGQLRKLEFQSRLEALQGELEQARAGLTALRQGERTEELRRREAAVRAAEARLTNARAEVERMRPLLPNRVVSRQEFERAERDYQVAQEEFSSAQDLLQKGTSGREEDIAGAEAQVRALEARLVEADLQLEDATLRAPYDGVIAELFMDVDQAIRANERVVTFQDLDELDIAVDVPETVMVADIELAEIVELTAELSAVPGVVFPVRIREINKVSDPVTQTFRVRVAMESPKNVRVLPGMTASVTMTYRRADILGSRILVPVTAVAQQASGEQVAWVVGGDDAVAARTVKVGQVRGGRIEILEGLEPGDRIAVAGVNSLREGMPVRDLGDALGGGL